MKLQALMRSAASDTYIVGLRAFSYLYWNAKGVRVTPEAYVHMRASVAPTCSFFGSSRVYSRARVGPFTYGTNCIIDNAHIGKFCSLAPGSLIGLNSHPLDQISLHPLTYDAADYDARIAPAVVGSDVWVGANAVILCGVTIPDGCVVAAGAVVTKSPDPFSIIGGVPARIIGKRHGDRSFVEAISSTDDISILGELAATARMGWTTTPNLDKSQ